MHSVRAEEGLASKRVMGHKPPKQRGPRRAVSSERRGGHGGAGVSPSSNSMLSPLVGKMAWDDLPLSPTARDKCRERQRRPRAGGKCSHRLSIRTGAGAEASGLWPGPTRLAGTGGERQHHTAFPPAPLHCACPPISGGRAAHPCKAPSFQLPLEALGFRRWGWMMSWAGGSRCQLWPGRDQV